jgi:hypothetical protein
MIIKKKPLMRTLLLPFQRLALSDRQVIALLVGGFVLMLLGSVLGSPDTVWAEMAIAHAD